MRAAVAPRKGLRILVVDGAEQRVVPGSALPTLLRAGDLVVVNDAATLPASLAADDLELRLAAAIDDRTWTAAVLGAGDYCTRTEDRPAPRILRVGEVLHFAELSATVVRIHSARLVDVELSATGSIWEALYRVGKPVQYAHVPERFALWDVQNVYAARPWAVEMPSAGRSIDARALLELGRRGIAIATVTHAAGLSAIGTPELDALLPLPERYEVSEETWCAIDRAKKAGSRVIAIGTSVVRALEGGARVGKTTGITDLKLGPGARRAVVDAVLTGIHDVETSHFALLGAFVSREVLDRALVRAEAEGLLGHEMGDACLVWGEPKAKRVVQFAGIEDRSRGRSAHR